MEKNRICKWCNQEFQNIDHNFFANHVRWCSKNPKDARKNLREKLRKSNTLNRIEIEKKCKKCNKNFIVIRTVKKNGIEHISKKEKKFCSRKCANGHIQTKEQNEKRSLKLQGKYFGINKKERFCLICNKPIQRNKHGKCKKCYELVRKENFRKNLNEKQKYRLNCQFKFSLNDYPEKFDFTLIEKYGWYKAKNHGNNQQGVSRDHIVSINFGFKNNIDSSIISHPANCQLLRHHKNVSKGSKNTLQDVEDLKIRIIEWDKKYK